MGIRAGTIREYGGRMSKKGGGKWGRGGYVGRCSAVWGVITVGWLPGRPAGQSPYGPAPGGAVIAAGPSPLHGQHSKQNGSKSSHSDPPALTLEINCLHHIHETT